MKIHDEQAIAGDEVAVALARAEVYHLLSQLFRLPQTNDKTGIPEGERLQRLAEFFSFWQIEEEAVTAAKRLGEALDKTSPGDFSLLHQRVFGHTISKSHPPYETEYGHLHAFRQTQELADIAGFYRAFGFDLSPQAKERCDFIGVELEFMYALVMKEAYALSHHLPEEMEICRDAERRFLERHLGRWVPAFAMLLRYAAGENLFVEVALILQAFVAYEVERLAGEVDCYDPGSLKPAEEPLPMECCAGDLSSDEFQTKED